MLVFTGVVAFKGKLIWNFWYPERSFCSVKPRVEQGIIMRKYSLFCPLLKLIFRILESMHLWILPAFLEDTGIVNPWKLMNELFKGSCSWWVWPRVTLTSGIPSPSCSLHAFICPSRLILVWTFCVLVLFGLWIVFIVSFVSSNNLQ